MLVLTRKPQERIVISDEIVVTVVRIAGGGYFLRLSLPERHAATIHEGDTVQVGTRVLSADLSAVPAALKPGRVVKVYPEITGGQVLADVDVAGLGDYFVGERIRVWVSAGQRQSVTVPGSFIVTRFGIDYARPRQADGGAIDVPVQRGRELPRPDMPDALEILSGLKSGDGLVQP